MYCILHSSRLFPFPSLLIFSVSSTQLPRPFFSNNVHYPICDCLYNYYYYFIFHKRGVDFVQFGFTDDFVDEEKSCKCKVRNCKMDNRILQSTSSDVAGHH